MIVFVDVELVSPVMVGGANPPERGAETPEDRWAFDAPALLRPPSIKGCLRFWTRALAGQRDPWVVERELWGSLEFGQGTSVLPSVTLGEVTSRRLLPRKSFDSSTPMVRPGAKVRLRWQLAEPARRQQLAAVVWTWIHLGTLGRRARRGYGSLLWEPVEGDLLEGFRPLERGVDLESREALESYLVAGLAEVEARLGAPNTARGGAAVRRGCNGWFRLETIDQVFVGSLQEAEYDETVNGMEQRLHGMDPAARLVGGPGQPGEQREMGTAGSGDRLASPMRWRVFPASDGGGYWPVMTWSPLVVDRLTPGTNMASELQSDLGFQQSLAGFGLT